MARREQLAKLLAGFAVATLLVAAPVACYPALYAARYAERCTDQPTSHFGKVHDFIPAPDRTVAFTVVSAASGRPAPLVAGVGQVCAGGKYRLGLSFGAPSLRNYLLTASHGAFSGAANDCDAWCPNRLCSTAPAPRASALLSLPCGLADGTKVVVKVTSASGRTPTPGSALRTAALSLRVDARCGSCAGTPATAAERAGT